MPKMSPGKILKRYCEKQIICMGLKSANQLKTIFCFGDATLRDVSKMYILFVFVHSCFKCDTNIYCCGC